MTCRVSSESLKAVAVAAVSAIVLAGCGKLPVGVTAAEVQDALQRKMPLSKGGVVITAPKVQLGEPVGGLQVCARWELAPSALAGLLRLGGDVCGAGKLRWDQSTCEVKLDAPAITKASLDNASEIPRRVLDPLSTLVTQDLAGLTVYKANSATCFVVKGIRTTPEKIEVLL